MLAGASLTGSLTTVLGSFGGIVALVQLLRTPHTPYSAESRILAGVFGGYFALFALTTALNATDPGRFREFAIIGRFLYFIPLILLLPCVCHDLTLKGIGRAAMLGTLPTTLIMLFQTKALGMVEVPLAAGNPNVASGLLLVQSCLGVAGWQQIN